MSQSFTDDVYASGHVAATDLQNIENNFAALKSTFSGASAPSNPVAGMWWYDTTNSILKLRDSSNASWLELYDFDNEKFLAGVGDGLITAAMIDGSAVKPSLVASQTIAPAVVNASTSVSAPSGSFTTLTVTNASPVPYSSIFSAHDLSWVRTGTSYSTIATCRVYILDTATTMTLAAEGRNDPTTRIASTL